MEQAEGMGGFYGFLGWLESLPLAEAIRVGIWWFPIVETTHVLAIVFVLGSIARVDLRLIGVIARDRPITHLSDEMLPWTWTSFVIAAISGTALFTARAIHYVDTIYFDLKMILMLAAGINMLYFEYVTKKTSTQWDRDTRPPGNVRFAGATSLILWLGVVVTGRFIGFV